MGSGLEKTIVIISFIAIGFLLKKKFKSGDELSGIKKIILNLALPATIFIALLGVQVERGLLLLPLLALVLNLFLFLVVPILLPFIGVKRNTPEYRTARLLLPSLAPGLSCFPFVLEFLGEPFLAKAAMADLGNKIFVLLILYFLAIQWHYRVQSETKKAALSFTKMFRVLVSEPVNIFIAVALLLLALGVTMNSLPYVISDVLQKLSFVMTPLVLLYIGLAVKIKKKRFLQIFSLLCLRAGITVLLASVFIFTGIIKLQNDILLLLSFSLSACSFWPYAHVSVVDGLETGVNPEARTFQNRFAINILALSFPFSTTLILVVLNGGAFFASSPNSIGLGVLLCTLGLSPLFIKRISKSISSKKGPVEKLETVKPEHA